VSEGASPTASPPATARCFHTRVGLPPGPPLPAVAQTWLWIARPLEFMDACRQRYGDVFTTRFTGLGRPRTVVFIADPDGVRTVFAGDADTLRAGSAEATNAALTPIMGKNSLLLLDGARHLRERKLMLPPFHGSRLTGYEQTMRAIVVAAMATWPWRRAFPLLSELQDITLEIILRVVFGFDERHSRPMRLLIKRMLTFGSGNLRLVSIAFAQKEMSGLTPWGRFVRAKGAVERALLAQVRRRRESGIPRDDVLSLLLEARDEHDEAMSDEELRDHLITLLVAGYETTATAMAWAFDLLTHHPKVLERVVADIDAGETRYLDAVIKETLRLRPVVPVATRMLHAPYEVLGHKLPAGTVVAPCIYLTQRRGDVYPEPQRFQPERFLNGAPEPYAWLPFGGGVRRCLGASFASFEMRVVLREVLAQLRLRAVDPAMEPTVRRAVTLVPRHGTRVVIEGARSRPAVAA
jgi:cytochrome P450